jgi:hypothetical protein
MHSYADNGLLKHELADHLIRCTTDDHNVRYGTDPSEFRTLLDSLLRKYFKLVDKRMSLKLCRKIEDEKSTYGSFNFIFA